MAISEFEVKKYEKAIEKFMERRRPPTYIRNEVDLGYRIDNQSVEIFEIRPQRNNPLEKIETPIAKATYVKTQKLWKVYWQRANMKWHSYEPQPTVKTLDAFLNTVDEDQYACFFG
ncbi:MAG: DUF3024 domain-containing protein [Nitrosomonas sp.]|nr:DUF3024 domain-containing protein [Nitrosomonas sp.]MDP1951030.1 DUF3024 domain-containing protein [Nitrosomonas sp.]